MIDREKFDDLYRHFDQDVINEIIEIFADEKPDRFEAIRKNLEEKNFTEMARNCHSLKGVVSNFMDQTTYDLACKLEEMALAENEEEISLILDDLDKACDMMIAELRTIIVA